MKCNHRTRYGRPARRWVAIGPWEKGPHGADRRPIKDPMQDLWGSVEET